MTTTLILAALLAGYLGGRRSWRRKLQTTDGRRRAGMLRTDTQAAPVDVPLVELFNPRTAAMPRVLPDIAPATRPIAAQQ